MPVMEFFFILLSICILIGILAVLGGVGGGVIFTPLMLGFTPIDSFIIRATGLPVAMSGLLMAARPFLLRGLVNIRLIFLAGVPTVCGPTFALQEVCLVGSRTKILLRLTH